MITETHFWLNRCIIQGFINFSVWLLLAFAGCRRAERSLRKKVFALGSLFVCLNPGSHVKNRTFSLVEEKKGREKILSFKIVVYAWWDKLWAS